MAEKTYLKNSFVFKFDFNRLNTELSLPSQFGLLHRFKEIEKKKKKKWNYLYILYFLT